MDKEILQAEHLGVRYGRKGSAALDDLSFALSRGMALGIAGESGSGKTTALRCLAGFQKPSSGRVILQGVDVTGGGWKAMKALEYPVQMIRQDTFSSLDPLSSVISLIEEPLLIKGKERKEARMEALGMMERTGLSTALASRHPMELSAGERQRAVIARALMPHPAVLLADEMTASLDASTASGIISLMRSLKDEGTSLVVVSHDLSLLERIADRLMILYRGKTLEEGRTDEILQHPAHPYTEALIAALPGNGGRMLLRTDRMPERSQSCPLLPRCMEARAECRKRRPVLSEVSPGHSAACFASESES